MTKPKATPEDLGRMLDLAAHTHAHVAEDEGSPFCSDVYVTATGRRLIRRFNAVRQENDPSSHAEVRAMRAACRKLRSSSLAGHTLYTTCEPCPMCMAMALWAGVDRVVYGATIADAARHCAQIYVSARRLQGLSDMDCEVVGPVARRECLAVFEDPRMLEKMRPWKKPRPKDRP